MNKKPEYAVKHACLPLSRRGSLDFFIQWWGRYRLNHWRSRFIRTCSLFLIA
ncbi:hypothetical protein PAHAL_9G274400 [Panicum hallii]|uniref:Uncharacterized protein n=1 Tax=Panicum hallii TaxID=206008 RepID=A0A2T8I2R9_9POAL|nr:hypothetical protein PAHAL_9G274400 [Panicum hallii]